MFSLLGNAQGLALVVTPEQGRVDPVHGGPSKQTPRGSVKLAKPLRGGLCLSLLLRANLFPPAGREGP
eukprot:3293615-Alexandrium_andersonii.AAC.1